MDSFSRTEGKTDQFKGNLKEKVGSTLGNDSMEREGAQQNISGNAQETAANASGYVQGLSDQISGAVKGAYNSLTGNSADEVGDKAQQKKGEAQEKFNS
ncbi:hypothetical protein BDF14DRAFT_1838784 [Spinellus fusiger]|nr:hypothetical protein BDF14DRAFT_1838784 [Spinellus fusiger]